MIETSFYERIALLAFSFQTNAWETQNCVAGEDCRQLLASCSNPAMSDNGLRISNTVIQAHAPTKHAHTQHTIDAHAREHCKTRTRPYNEAEISGPATAGPAPPPMI